MLIQRCTNPDNPSAARRRRGPIAPFVLDEPNTSVAPVVAVAAMPGLARGHDLVFAPEMRGPTLDVMKAFTADLATAPEIVGELTALYVEQHPPLAIRLVTRALVLLPDTAAAAIRAAVVWRGACGAEDLAIRLGAALDFVEGLRPRDAAADRPHPVFDLDWVVFDPA